MNDTSPIIYLDYSASTPLDPRVLAKMLPYFNEHFANPSSQHRAGWLAQHAISQSRKSLMKLLNLKKESEVIFTSGASEANTLGIVGFILSLQKQDCNRSLHALTSAVEHKSVLETFDQLKSLGIDVDVLNPNPYGEIELTTIKKHLRKETVLMSFMWANNELGSLNPIQEISSLAQENKICFHTDATQAVGKIPIDLDKIPVDFLSLSAHKMYGPKGTGALIRRFEKHHSTFDLCSIIRGGSQEHGLRAGTLNTPGIVGLGAASHLADTEFFLQDLPKINALTEYFLGSLYKIFPKLQLNGNPQKRIPGHLHLTFPGIRWDQWLPRMSELCVSTTSACNSEQSQGSHVLNAIGFNLNQIHSSLRISIGKTTTKEELDQALLIFNKALSHSGAVV